MTTPATAENTRIVFITTACDAARSMAKQLVEKRLAACVNVIGKIESHYWWDDAVQEDNESLLICKTTVSKLDALMAWVNETHSYDLPEVLAVKIDAGLPEYLAWVAKETEG
jgi:periplasmic divalent cation tolerance protein